jgi:20S proteasome alpha/beta subunit
MSLSIAAIASDGVVLVSDSRTISVIAGMNYAMDDIPKILTIGNHPMAFVGSLELMEEIFTSSAKIANPFSGAGTFPGDCAVLVRECRRIFEEKYGVSSYRDALACISGQTSVLIIGHGQYGGESGAYLYQVCPHEAFAPVKKLSIAIAGQDIHGGAYYMAKFYDSSMSMEQIAWIAYFSIREVASVDCAVGAPIYIWSVKDNAARDQTEEWGGKFIKRYEACRKTMRDWFSV